MQWSMNQSVDYGAVTIQFEVAKDGMIIIKSRLKNVQQTATITTTKKNNYYQNNVIIIDSINNDT